MADADETGGLGLGLNALFDEDNADATDAFVAEMEKGITAQPSAGQNRNVIGIEKLYPSPFQPRHNFSEESLDELAGSIKQYGVLQPLLVREDPKNLGHYEIIAGERRWRAAQRAQLHELPIIILELEEIEAYKIALIENLQRENLDPIDEALGYQRLLQDYNQTQEELAKAVGKSRPHIANMTRLLNLPEEVQGHVSAGRLSAGHARALITVTDPSAVALQVINKGLNVRQTEKLVSKMQNPQASSGGKARQKPKAPEKDADTIALENDISNALGMRVTIESEDGKSGQLNVEFKTLDQLDDLLHRLAHFPGSRLSG